MRSKTIGWLGIVVAGTTAIAFAQSLPTRAPVSTSIQRSYGKLPLTFEANRGQTDPQAQFISRGPGYTAFLTNYGMVLSLRAGDIAKRPATLNGPTHGPSTHATLQFRLLGASENPTVLGENQQPGKVNYFIGNDHSKWHTEVPTYSQARYRNIYPGIDLVYYGSHRQLEYDFAISAGADPGQIRFEISGAKQIEVDSDGNLRLETGGGELRFQTPIVYQESNGKRMPVNGGYVVEDSTHISFHVAHYDQNKPLVIDPVLLYSTYLGGSGNDQPGSIAVDANGCAYIVGSTDSSDFPLATVGSIAPGATHVFVAKLDSTGSNLMYTDILGGNSSDYGYALSLDAANNIYVTGSTASTDFPLVNPYQAVYPGGFDAFLTKISPNGSSLLYSTYFGGDGSTLPSSIAVDDSGHMIIAGYTSSTNMPVANAYQSAVFPNQGGMYGYVGFVTNFSPDGSSLVYSTYLGGSSNVALNCGGTPCWPEPENLISGMAIDATGNVYLAGTTNTYNFPVTANAYLKTNSIQMNYPVGFISRFTSSGDLQYSTYFYDPQGFITGVSAIAVDGSDSAYIAGIAIGNGTFPITSTGICDPEVSGWGCNYAFVIKFDATGSSLLYSTFLGANNNATPLAIALDKDNNAYVLAVTGSAAFSTANGIENYSGGSDLLLAEIDASGSTQLFATYLGGGGDDEPSPAGIAIDSGGIVYVAGRTSSSDFPVTQSAAQGIYGGNTDAFVLKIGPGSAPALTLSPPWLQYTSQQVGSTSQPQSVLLRNMGSAPLAISSLIIDGDFAETDDCGTAISASGTCTLSITFTPTAAGARTGSVVIHDDAAGSPHVISLNGTGLGVAAATVSPGSMTFSRQVVGTSSGPQMFTLTSSGSAALTVGTLQITGNFSQTNNCPSTLDVGHSCTINVIFTPTASGTHVGTLTVTDNAENSPQAFELTGTGSDFNLTSSPSSDTIKAGSSATYGLNVVPLGGAFTNAIQLSCSGVPANASCKFSSSSVTPGSNQTPVTLTINTMSMSANAATSPAGAHAFYAVWMQLEGLGLFGVVLAGYKPRSKKLAALLILVMLVGLLMLMSACAGGTGIAPKSPGAQPGTYTITVSGTSGALRHSLPVTLIVK